MDGLSQYLNSYSDYGDVPMAMENDKIQFRGAAEKQASQLVDQMRLGGINISELAREGLKGKLRETLSDEEKIKLYEQYKRGDLSEEVAIVLIGDALAEIERERDAFEEATSLDTDGVFQQ